MVENKIKKYEKESRKARIKVLEMIYDAQTSHIGSNFSAIDLLTVIYDMAKVDKEMKKDRDKVVVSKGWVAASIYYFLAQKGIIPKEDLEKYCKEDSQYIGLVEPNVRGIEASGGSMGFGLPFGTGFALAKKIKKEKGRVFVLMSDGEMQCGTTWESSLIASFQKLDNLVIVIDCNKLQAMGKVKDVLNIEPLKEKWKAFNFEVKEIDGHDFKEIEKSLSSFKKGKPTVVIAKTTKGKGISFMENDNQWHYRAPEKEEYEKALKELKKNG